MIFKNLKLRIFLILWSLFFFINTAFATIIVTSNVELIKDEIENLSNQDLIIFDVDEVLITPVDQILQVPYKKDLDKISTNLEKQNKSIIQELWSIILLESRYEKVNAKLFEIIKKFKNNKKILILTKAWTGKFGKIESLEDWRIKILKSHGLDLSDTSDFKNNIIFYELEAKNLPIKCLPMIKHKVLFSCGLPKGLVLEEFLSKIKFFPNKIILVDDKRENLDSVENFCKKKYITFLGFEYNAIKSKVVKPLNQKRSELQFQILLNNKKWLNDDEADLIIKTNN